MTIPIRPKNDFFNAFQILSVGSKKYGFYSLSALEKPGTSTLSSLPYSIRILLESVLRNGDGFTVAKSDIKNLAAWTPNVPTNVEIPFKPGRVILQDFTGVPAVVDLAAMRTAMRRLGGDPNKINPLVPVDLVVDHSVQTDYFGTEDSLTKNVDVEFRRNKERYSLLHWAQKSLDNFRVVPPSVGIIHQVNLEYLGRVVMKTPLASLPNFDGISDGDAIDSIVYPDSVVGTDSHTVMINGLGVLGWGVGGIEAEAVMLGQPYYMLAPQVVGFELTGRLNSGVTATDLVLTITQMLRQEGVVGKFVEYFGEGADSIPVADRAVLANMGPEYGATMGYFPVDRRTIDFLRQTGRDAEQVELVETYFKAQGLFRTSDVPTPNYTKILSLDLSTVVPSLAGPKRPQDRVPLSEMKSAFQKSLTAPIKERGFGLSEEETAKTGIVRANAELSQLQTNDSSVADEKNGQEIGQGAVVIASITSCTNTSNPNLMIAAGLLAKKAVARGLKTKSYVKTSLGPGSRVVTDYLKKANLLGDLEKLGFNVVGYGCLTCIGNSGPLPEPVAKAVVENDLVVSAVLSGNRNFEGRVNPLVKANYLASPPLVVAFAIAGTTKIDLTTEPIGFDSEGKPVMLAEIFPTNDEIEAAAKNALNSEMYATRYSNVFDSNELWNAIPTVPSELYPWDESSSYIQEPPFLVETGRELRPVEPIRDARALLLLGDSVTTDHISPAGAIKKDSPAGSYLIERGVAPTDFNSYGSRRGNDRVMTRGTFANIRIRNLLVPGSEGGVTKFLGADSFDGEVMSVYDAAIRYQKQGTPLIVLAGAEYGTGSSRDWAAKGTQLLGVQAVLASSFERIHRGNLVGMGVLPLEFTKGQTCSSLGLDGTEIFSIESIGPNFIPRSEISIVARSTNPQTAGRETKFKVCVRIDAPVELVYYLNGGILQTVVRKLLQS